MSAYSVCLRVVRGNLRVADSCGLSCVLGPNWTIWDCEASNCVSYSDPCAKMVATISTVVNITMRPSTALKLHRIAVRQAASRFRTVNPRVFGSALHGTDKNGSDLDLLVDALPGVTLFDLGGLQAELESGLGIQVDLLTPADLPATFRDSVLAGALRYE